MCHVKEHVLRANLMEETAEFDSKAVKNKK